MISLHVYFFIWLLSKNVLNSIVISSILKVFLCRSHHYFSNFALWTLLKLIIIFSKNQLNYHLSLFLPTYLITRSYCSYYICWILVFEDYMQVFHLRSFFGFILVKFNRAGIMHLTNWNQYHSFLYLDIITILNCQIYYNIS
jgi:hypothetical protein